jgi:acyl-CoA thioesterase-2
VHGYFILPGDIAAPIVYFVDRLRDGKSFTTRRVTAIQHGRAIFNLAASFHLAEQGLVHQPPMPEVAPPEELRNELELIREMADRIPERLRAIFTQDRPIDFRPIDPVDFFHPERRPALKYMWVKAVGTMSADVLMHQAVLAYASDYGLLATALLPHGMPLRSPGVQAASLDHSIWFHRPFRADEWLLYVMESPNAGGARAFTRGTVYTREGDLVASVAQEGLLRIHEA